jgi:hypothetical protein
MTENTLKGKGEKARIRLNALENEISLARNMLKDIHDELLKIIKEKEGDIKNIKPQSTFLGNLKLRSMLNDMSNRIEFEFNGLKFYIDFTLVPLERDDLIEINGSIIYGTNRTLCFSECIYPDKTNKKKCENCERILRCDRLEDKPLIHFLVNRNGIIKCKDKLEDEMWTTENNKDLLDLHYRTLDLIWKDALDWTNEELLP